MSPVFQVVPTLTPGVPGEPNPPTPLAQAESSNAGDVQLAAGVAVVYRHVEPVGRTVVCVGNGPHASTFRWSSALYFLTIAGSVNIFMNSPPTTLRAVNSLLVLSIAW